MRTGLDVVSVNAADGKQLVRITSWNKALSGENPIERELYKIERPITGKKVISCLRELKKEMPELEGAQLYFKSIASMHFGGGVKI